ncbi:MAG: LysR family transcriptional regulator, partial [Peptococcaceae bacterium]|nr:LysR family transcriptional regulator [Peptococcaceae bacterium]
MQFEQLRCLVEVADTGSITAAAKRMYISQQAVSVKIKQLEEELQCSLLVREKDGVSLTQKGKETVAFAQKMLAERDTFYNQIRNNAEVEKVTIRVCSTSSVTNIVLPNVIDRMESKQR